jgi:hypothetical protein
MRALSATTVVVVVLALASCSKNGADDADSGTDAAAGSSGVAGTGEHGGAGGAGAAGGRAGGAGGSGDAGSGGAGGGGAGGSAGGGGAGGRFACGDTTCAAGDVCVREQTLGGACFPVDAGCPAGTSPVSPCCVQDPSYTCVPFPSACNGKLSCDCARQAICAAGRNCATPTSFEIDCTLLAP